MYLLGLLEGNDDVPVAVDEQEREFCDLTVCMEDRRGFKEQMGLLREPLTDQDLLHKGDHDGALLGVGVAFPVIPIPRLPLPCLYIHTKMTCT